MAIYSRKTFNSFPKEDKGVPVVVALKLIENSPFYDDIMEEFDIDSKLNEFIEVPGASTLVNSVLTMESKVEKIDIHSKICDVHTLGFTEEAQAILQIKNIENDRLIEIFGTGFINAETTYSVRPDYFNEFYEINRYLSFLLDKQFKDIVDNNIASLEKKFENDDRQKKFRLVIDEDNDLFIRAITSTTRYKDYNIAFSVFITLIQLHELFKINEESFVVSSFSLTESEIKVIFKHSKTYEFIDKSNISFSLVLTNDEIKREAVRLKGLFSINFGVDKDVYVQPKEGDSVITSFTHGLNASTVKERLSKLDTLIGEFIDNTINDFDLVKKIKGIDKLREYLVWKTKNARNDEFKQYKREVLKLLSNRVNTVFQLLEIAGKIDDIIKDEHIQARDFWRYKLYQALIEEAKKKKS